MCRARSSDETFKRTMAQQEFSRARLVSPSDPKFLEFVAGGCMFEVVVRINDHSVLLDEVFVG